MFNPGEFIYWVSRSNAYCSSRLEHAEAPQKGTKGTKRKRPTIDDAWGAEFR